MSRFNNKYYNISKNPHKILFFIHGYNGDIVDIEPAMEDLASKIPDVMIDTPQSPIVCDKNVDKKQWFSLLKFDAQNQRRNIDTDLTKVIDIYNSTAEDIAEQAKLINQYIDEKQKEFGIGDENTFIGGFSQGAMLALYTSLSRKNKVAGCIMMSGVVAGWDRLKNEVCSRPDVLLVHGTADVSVQYRTHDYSLECLHSLSIKTDTLIMPDVAHRLTGEGMSKIAEFIKSH